MDVIDHIHCRSDVVDRKQQRDQAVCVCIRRSGMSTFICGRSRVQSITLIVILQCLRECMVMWSYGGSGALSLSEVE